MPRFSLTAHGTFTDAGERVSIDPNDPADCASGTDAICRVLICNLGNLYIFEDRNRDNTLVRGAVMGASKKLHSSNKIEFNRLFLEFESPKRTTSHRGEIFL